VKESQPIFEDLAFFSTKDTESGKELNDMFEMSSCYEPHSKL